MSITKIAYTTSEVANYIEQYNLLNNATEQNSMTKCIYRYIEDAMRRKNRNVLYTGLTVTKKDDDELTISAGEAMIAGRLFLTSSGTDYQVTSGGSDTYYIYIRAEEDTGGFPLITETDNRDPTKEVFHFAHATTVDQTDDRLFILAKFSTVADIIQASITMIAKEDTIFADYLSPTDASSITFRTGTYVNRTDVGFIDDTKMQLSVPLEMNGADIDLGTNNFIVDSGGDVTLSAAELAYLDSLDQSITTTDSPTFAGLTLTSIATFSGSDATYTVPIIMSGANVDLDGNSLVLSAVTLTDTELAYIDGQDQSVATTDTPTFAGLNSTGNIDLNANSLIVDSGGDKTLTATELAYLDGLDQAVNTASSPTFAGLTMTGDIDLDGNNFILGSVTLSDTELTYIDGLDQYLATDQNVTFADIAATGNISITGNISSGVFQGTPITNSYIAGIDQDLLIASSPTFSNLAITNNITNGTWQGGVIQDAYIANDITLTNLTQITTSNHSDLTGTTEDDHHNQRTQNMTFVNTARTSHTKNGQGTQVWTDYDARISTALSDITYAKIRGCFVTSAAGVSGSTSIYVMFVFPDATDISIASEGYSSPSGSEYNYFDYDLSSYLGKLVDGRYRVQIEIVNGGTDLDGTGQLQSLFLDIG